jgi:hypothetical protein
MNFRIFCMIGSRRKLVAVSVDGDVGLHGRQIHAGT